MSMSNIEHADFTVQEREATMSIVAGGSFAEAIGGIGAVVRLRSPLRAETCCKGILSC